MAAKDDLLAEARGETWDLRPSALHWLDTVLDLYTDADIRLCGGTFLSAAQCLDWIEGATAEVKRLGMLVPAGKKGRQKQNPALKIIHDARTDFISLCKLLKLSGREPTPGRRLHRRVF